MISTYTRRRSSVSEYDSLRSSASTGLYSGHARLPQAQGGYLMGESNAEVSTVAPKYSETAVCVRDR